MDGKGKHRDGTMGRYNCIEMVRDGWILPCMYDTVREIEGETKGKVRICNEGHGRGQQRREMNLYVNDE